MPIKSKVIYPRGQRVKFTKSGKYEYDFKKGDYGIVERVISPFPSATDTIYLILPEKSGELSWVTGDDIVAFNQTTLDEEIHNFVNDKSKVRCEADYYDGLVPCIKLKGHAGVHESAAGLPWLTPHPGPIPYYDDEWQESHPYFKNRRGF